MQAYAILFVILRHFCSLVRQKYTEIAYISAKSASTKGVPIGCSVNWCSSGVSPLGGGGGTLLGVVTILAICGACIAAGGATWRVEAIETKVVMGTTVPDAVLIPREEEEEGWEVVAGVTPAPPPTACICELLVVHKPFISG